MLGSNTVIYVTHQVEFLPSADLILVMRDGRITQAGKYNDILNSGTDFMELVGAHRQALSALDSKERGPDSEHTINLKSSPSQSESTEQDLHTEKRNDQNGKTDGIAEQKGQLVQEEEREKGRVGLSVYWKYVTTAYGGALVPFILLAQVLFQLLQIGSNYWMAWAAPVSKDAKAPVEGLVLILVYVALAIGSSFCILARALLLSTAGYKTATLLFSKMHTCIFRASMSFFDATPSGRILNRASTDQSTVDEDIPFEIGSTAFTIIQLLGIIAVMSQVAWQVFIVFIPAVAVCIWYQQYYIPTARELSRLVGVCKAPNIQHFAESLSGSTTIRSFDQESRFVDTNLKLIDDYSRPKFHTAGAMQWLCFRLDIFSSIVFAFSLVFLISIPQGIIDPGTAGLAVTYGLNLNMLATWVVWNLCNLENRIISVERILQYTNIPSEPPLVVETNRPELNWPTKGEVDIHDLQVRYTPHMPLVLRGLTCTFPGGMKTGIVGRTGSGKSTLIQTLFRIVDPVGGQILIDGIDISSIGLHDLRSRLSIIPQEPTMFEGTVRSNLDPLEEYTDEQIWEALDRCQLGDEVRKKEGKLDSTVTENGENWSMGQRQLVCLGRVLLKRSKVLVLDEATASVDTATDNLIQQTLRQEFSDCTVITIAHRITSVLDSDMVLLLDNGLIAELDSPDQLLENNLREKLNAHNCLPRLNIALDSSQLLCRAVTSKEYVANGDRHSRLGIWREESEVEACGGLMGKTRALATAAELETSPYAEAFEQTLAVQSSPNHPQAAPIRLVRRHRSRCLINLFEMLLWGPDFRCSDPCRGDPDLSLGLQLQSLALKFGFESETFVGNALVSLYARFYLVEEAKRMFDEMRHRDLVSWNALISGYTQEGNYGLEAIWVFVEMLKEDLELDHVSFTGAISACGHERNLCVGRQVQGLAIKAGYGEHVSVSNVLLSLYSKCEMLQDAYMVFANMIERNVISWTTMISMDKTNAVLLFSCMLKDGVYPNDVTFIGLVHAISSENLVTDGQTVHGFCLKAESQRVFDELKYKEVVSWNALMSGYAQNGLCQEALEIFSLMIWEENPNQFTFGSILSSIASADAVSLMHGQQFHCWIIKLGLNTDEVVLGALLDMYAKRGSIEESQDVFNELPQQNLVAWTTIISSHAQHGDYKAVMDLLRMMEKAEVKPDGITFLAVLAACGRKGMVDVGRQVFNSMVRDYLIEPSAEHFACVVDMLGRAGQLDEAEEFLKQMPMGPGLSALQSLLGACRIHGNFEIGKRVADALMEMGPMESGVYVLMSNIYAENGEWEKVAKIRKLMRERGVKKEVGFSWVDIGHIDGTTHMHGFSSDDRSHPKAEEICRMVECLGLEMKFLEIEKGNLKWYLELAA
ncbi:hypothetical protein ACLOJK_031973 [Asimina triloba]